MEINWIKIAIGAIVALIIYALYKVVYVIKDIKQMKQSMHMLPSPSPVQTAAKPPTAVKPPSASVDKQPIIDDNERFHQTPAKTIPIKIQPPTFRYNKLETVNEVDHLDNASEHEETEDSDYQNDDAEEIVFEHDQDNIDMIIPLDLNSILEHVINDKMTAKKPHTEIEEIVSDTPSSAKSSPVKNDDLKSKTMAELKELAKSHNIKLTENGKPKNKETLIKEISNI